MKKQLLTTVFLLFVLTIFAQSDSIIVEKKIFKIDGRFRIGIFRTFPQGNTTYAKDLKPIIGFNTGLTIFSLYDFNLGAGVDFGRFNIKNQENIGTFSTAKTNAYHFEINRDIKINSEFKLIPYFGLGQTEFVLRERGVKRLGNNGNSYRLGCLTTYKLVEKTNLYLGLEYNSVKYDVQTIPTLVDYYNQNNQIILSIGLMMN